MKLSILALLTTMTAAFLMSGCNTMRGMGEDLQSAGRAISGAAEDASN